MDPDAPVHYAKVYFPLIFFIPRAYSFYLNYFKVLVLQVDTMVNFFLLLQFCGFFTAIGDGELLRCFVDSTYLLT